MTVGQEYQKLAEHIYKCLEGEERDIKSASEFDGTERDFYFIGFVLTEIHVPILRMC